MPKNLDFSYPGNQYMPGKFGKNNIKRSGVSKYTTIVAPPSGDALVPPRRRRAITWRGLRIDLRSRRARGS